MFVQVNTQWPLILHSFLGIGWVENVKDRGCEWQILVSEQILRYIYIYHVCLKKQTVRLTSEMP